MELNNLPPRYSPHITLSYSLIHELNSTRSDWKIKVRVSRLWDVETSKRKGFIFCTDMVLIDEEGEYVHATLPSGNSSRLRQKLVEGKVYIIKNFEIKNNKHLYRVVSDSKIMIDLHFDTFVKVIDEEENIIPRHRFDFVAFHNLDKRRENFDVLSDVVGHFVDGFGEGINDLKIEIQDKSGQKIRVKLWGRCITDFQEQRRQLAGTNNPLIVTITSLLVKDYNGFMSLSTSPSSKLYINLDIDEVNELKTLLMEKADGSAGTIVDFQSCASNENDIQSILDHCNKAYEKDSIMTCCATVTRINTKSPWYYSSCIDCNSKPYERATDFWCFKCEKRIENRTLRYRIELCVEDKSGFTIFTVLDNEAKKLMGQDASTLYDTYVTEVDEDDENASQIPELLQNLFVGKELLFRFKITSYNDNPKNRLTFSVLKIMGKPDIKVDEASTSSNEPTTKLKQPQFDDTENTPAPCYKKGKGIYDVEN